MVKIRLKRLGYKKNPTYRVIVIDSRSKREGAPIEELGHYNPKTKEMKLNKAKAVAWIQKGAQPTETVEYLIKNCKEDGTLNYEKKTAVKLSKKALAKAEEAKKAKEAAKKAEAEAAAAPVAEVAADVAPAVEVTVAEAAEAPAAKEAADEAAAEKINEAESAESVQE